MEFKMIDFGKNLTGRPYGKRVYEEMRPSLKGTVTLNFQGVFSLGSSFGDEVVPPLAFQQGKKIVVKNANKSIKNILKDVANDAKIQIVFEDFMEG